MKAINLENMRFGRLLVIKRVPSAPGRIAWLCKCDCGNEHTTTSGALSSERTKSCGCLRAEKMAENRRSGGRLRHGMSNSPEHKVWMGMNERCINPNSKFFFRYGGRGITICDRWRVFENFYADMGQRPVGMTLDRENNDGNYEPSNCRWATQVEQMNNTCSNVRITIAGETKTLSQWSRAYGVDKDLASQRILRDGWSPEDAVTIPSRSLRRYKNPNRAICDLKIG
jgi:hypothetical protein